MKLNFSYVGDSWLLKNSSRRRNDFKHVRAKSTVLSKHEQKEFFLLSHVNTQSIPDKKEPYGMNGDQ